MKRSTRSALICLLLAVATTSQAQQPAPESAAVKAATQSCGPPSEHFKVHLHKAIAPANTPDPDKATVYFLTGPVRGLWIKPTVRIGMDGRWVSAIKPDSYVELKLPPGMHHFCIRLPGYLYSPEPAYLYGIDLKPAQSYYFAVTDETGGMFQPVDLVFLNLIDSDEGRLLVAQSRQAAATSKSHPRNPIPQSP